MTIRTGAEITTEEFVAAYNNRNLTNQQVIDTLQTTWEVVRKKVRSNAIQSQLTVLRTGGASGTWTALEDTPATTSAPVIDADTTTTAPAVETTTTTTEAATVEAETTTEVTPTPVDEAEVTTVAPAIPTVQGTSPEDFSNEYPEYGFWFKALIAGQEFVFGGENKKAAVRQLLIEAQELKMKNIIIRTMNQNEIQLVEIQHARTYTVVDQQSAA